MCVDLFEFESLSEVERKKVINNLNKKNKEIEEKDTFKREILNDIPFSLKRTMEQYEELATVENFIQEKLEETGFILSIRDNEKIRLWHFKKSSEMPEDEYYQIYLDKSLKVESTNVDKTDLDKVMKILDPKGETEYFNSITENEKKEIS